MSQLFVRFLAHAAKPRCVALAVIIAMCFVSATARAQYRRRVVLLEPSHEDNVGVEIQARLRGELTGAGFDVVLWPIGDVADPEQAVDSTARELQPAAVLLVRLETTEGDSQLAELWISDRLLRRVFVQRVTFDTDDQSRGAARLAVQAVELLKARLAELAVSGETKPPQQDTKPRPSPPRVRPERRASGLGLQAGAGLLHGFGEVEAVWTPLFQLGMSLPELGDAPLALDLRGSLAAFGKTASVSAGQSSADVEQAFGTLDAVVRFAPRSVVQPLMAFGTGVYTVHVEGRADAPFTEHTERTWSMLNTISGGLLVEPVRGITCKLEAGLMGAWSGTVVRIDGDEVAHAGTPMLLLSAGVGGVF